MLRPSMRALMHDRIDPLAAAAAALAFAAGAAALPPPAFAQAANPAFVGTWRSDLERSDAINREGLKVDSTMKLSLSGDDLVIERSFVIGGNAESDPTVSWTYVTDGKPHTVPGLRQTTREARAKWKKDKLTVSYTVGQQTPQGAFEVDVNETWQIEDNGDLVIRYLTRLPDRQQIRDEVFRPATEE